MFRIVANRKNKKSYKIIANLILLLICSACSKTPDTTTENISPASNAIVSKPYYLFEVRTISGERNNLIIPDLGATHTQLQRAIAADYTDGIASMNGISRPNPRTLSNALSSQDESKLNPYNLSCMIFQWGQFLDHDLSLTEAAIPYEPFDIQMPGDQHFFIGSSMPFLRSIYDIDTGTGVENPREQINEITAFIDASNVYGSDELRASFLRTNDGTGRLKTSVNNMLPYNTDGLPNAGGPSENLFIAGDVRANEQVGLTSLHTLFVREHNRLADLFRFNNTNWSGETIYQAARAYVAAQMQVITYKEFLPLLIGGLESEYTGYDTFIDPSIRNEFSTAAYRFGHTTIPSNLLRLDKNGLPIEQGNLSLAESFFNPALLEQTTGTDIDPVLRGLVMQKSENVDLLRFRRFGFSNTQYSTW